MSFHYSNAAWNNYPEIKAGGLLVLLSLCDRANDSGICWPSIADISRRTRLGERQVTRLLGELERKHKVIIRHSQKGMNGVNRYTLTFQPERVTSRAGGGDVHVAPGVTPTTPKSPKNHQRTYYNYEQRKKPYANLPSTDTQQRLATAF